MSRLTKKIKNSFCGYLPKDPYFLEYINADRRNLEETYDVDLSLLVDKLGEIEDIMSKYKIRSVGELDEKLSSKGFYTEIGNRGGAKTLTALGLHYTDLEKKLGCSFETIIKATTNGIIDFEGKKYEVLFGGYYLFVVEEDELRHAFSLKNYRKSWWLVGDKR